MNSGRLGAGGGGAGPWQHLARGTASPLSRLRAASPTGGQAEDTEASHEALPHPLLCVKGCQGSGEILLEGGPSSVPSRTKNFAACGGDARCRRPEGTDAAPAICTCSAGTLPPPPKIWHTHPLSQDGDKFWRMPECYIRGSTIKYLRIPDEIIDMVKEEVVAKGRGRGGLQQQKQQKGRGMGGAGRGMPFSPCFLPSRLLGPPHWRG